MGKDWYWHAIPRAVMWGHLLGCLNKIACYHFLCTPLLSFDSFISSIRVFFGQFILDRTTTASILPCIFHIIYRVLPTSTCEMEQVSFISYCSAFWCRPSVSSVCFCDGSALQSLGCQCVVSKLLSALVPSLIISATHLMAWAWALCCSFFSCSMWIPSWCFCSEVHLFCVASRTIWPGCWLAFLVWVTGHDICSEEWAHKLWMVKCGTRKCLSLVCLQTQNRTSTNTSHPLSTPLANSSSNCFEI